MLCWEDSQDSVQRGGVRGHDLLQWKDASRQQRERGAQGEGQGNQA